jgi:hypothetical protein
MRRPGRKGANHRPGRRLPMGRADRGRLDAIRLRRDCLMRFESCRECLPMVKPTSRGCNPAGEPQPRCRLHAIRRTGRDRLADDDDPARQGGRRGGKNPWRAGRRQLPQARTVTLRGAVALCVTCGRPPSPRQFRASSTPGAKHQTGLTSPKIENPHLGDSPSSV